MLEFRIYYGQQLLQATAGEKSRTRESTSYSTKQSKSENIFQLPEVSGIWRTVLTWSDFHNICSE